MSNTTVPISEWCKEIRVALARKEMNLQSVADEIGYSYTTITALISGRIVRIITWISQRKLTKFWK